MVDFARIQNRIYYGYGKAAQRLGTEHAVYRSADGIDPLKADNFLFNQLIGIDQDYTYKKTKKYNDPVWQMLPENGLVLQNFDYLVAQTVTYFIVDIAPEDRLNPPICVECNTTISITRPSNLANNTIAPGKNPYQAYNPNQEQILFNCPVSLLQHSKMDSKNMGLPTSVRLPMYQIILPQFDNVFIKTGDTINEITGRRFSVIPAERTKKTLGFRIIAVEEGV